MRDEYGVMTVMTFTLLTMMSDRATSASLTFTKNFSAGQKYLFFFANINQSALLCFVDVAQKYRSQSFTLNFYYQKGRRS